MNGRVSRLLSILLLIDAVALGGAQVTAPPITRPGSIQDSGSLGYWTEMTPQGRAGGYLLGKVVLESEIALWEPIIVSVDCNGTEEFATRTDRKGSFLITSSHIQAALSLQSDAKRQMETFYEGCTVQAHLAGFRSTTLTIAHRNLRDDPDLGTITLQKDDKSTGTALSETTPSAPAGALKAFLKARSDLIDNEPDRAQRELQKAVEIFPGFAEAWYQLGKLQLASDQAGARDSFSKAVAADPRFVPPYQPLISLSVQAAQWPEVLAASNHALQLDPAGTPQLWFYNALANFQLGKLDPAESSANRSLAIDPSHTVPNSEQLLAVILTRRHDYAGAVAHLRHCLTYLPSGPSSDLVTRQIAQLEKLAAAKK